MLQPEASDAGTEFAIAGRTLPLQATIRFCCNRRCAELQPTCVLLEPRTTGVGAARFAATADEKSYKRRLEMLEVTNATSKRVVCEGARRRRCAASSPDGCAGCNHGWPASAHEGIHHGPSEAVGEGAKDKERTATNHCIERAWCDRPKFGPARRRLSVAKNI